MQDRQSSLGTDADQRPNADAPPDVAPAWLGVSRSVAGFLGCFAMLNLIGELFHPGFDANILWIDLRPLPALVARGLLGLAASALLLFAVHPGLSGPTRRTVQFTVSLLLATSLANTIQFLALVRSGTIQTDFPIPFSAQVTCLLLVILAGTISPSSAVPTGARDAWIVLLTLLLCIVAFPVSQLYCFGKTDYRRPADVVVVFGCRVYADGTPSPSLQHRMQTASSLVTDGVADYLIVSGGPGDGEFHETDTMKRLAIEQGVAPDRILVDRDGVNTQATILHSARIVHEREWKRVLAVSDFYHLPRIKLTFRRTGMEVWTVPASADPPDLPFQIIRETVAWWFYYLQPRDAADD